MRIKCPVVLCGWEGKTHQFYKHIEDYKMKWKGVMDYGFLRSESHERWANYRFPQIWKSDLPKRVKWATIARAYVESLRKSGTTPKHKLPSGHSDKIEMHDSKIMMNGREYSSEEFSKVMPGIKTQKGTEHEVKLDR